MSESLEFNLLEDETREYPFKYFEAILHLDKPVYFMPELGAYYTIVPVLRWPGRRCILHSPFFYIGWRTSGPWLPTNPSDTCPAVSSGGSQTCTLNST